MFCKHCGSKIDDDVAFCPSCGKPQGAAVVAQAVPAAHGGGESYFDGGVFQRLGWKILGSLVTAFTFGICYPFAVNWMYSWEARHTVIGGRRLKFTGSAGGLFGTWIVCLLLCLVTLGIYYFWVPLKIRKWREANTFFEDEIPMFDAEQRLRREKASRFDGGLLQYVGWNILGALVTMFTAGICYPWAVQMVYSWEQRHKVYCGRRCTFDGRAIGLFGTWMLCLLLCLVTFGIYAFWVPLRIQRWKVKHTHLLADDTPAEEQENKGLTAEEINAKRAENSAQLLLLYRLGGPAAIVLGTVISLELWGFATRRFGAVLGRSGLLSVEVPFLCAVGMIVLNFVKIGRVKRLTLIKSILVALALVAAFALTGHHGIRSNVLNLLRWAPVFAMIEILQKLIVYGGIGLTAVGLLKDVFGDVPLKDIGNALLEGVKNAKKAASGNE